jgi:hypothetical protein
MRSDAMKRAAVALLIVLSVTTTATAQTCVPTDTPEMCWNKFNPVAPSPEAVATTVATTNTGSPNLSSITNTTLRDFLSVFTGVVSTSTLTENNGAFTLDYNLPVNLLHDNDVIKFQATFATPDLDPALVTALGTNASAITTLTDSLDQADDITASATFSPSTDRFGRTFANHRDLVESLMNAVMANRGADSTPRLLAAFADAAAGNPALQLDTPFTVITDPTQQANALNKLQAAAASLPQFAAENKTLIDNVAELINNQEQIYFSAQYNDLNSLAGASTWTVNGTYAMGGKNITKFLAAQKKLGNCDLGQMVKEQSSSNPPAVSQTCLQQLNAYVGGATIDRTWRLALSLDLSRTEANTINISQLSTPISTPQVDSQMFSLTAGRRFDPPSSTRERRIDVTASYENVSNDPNLEDRLIASVTWTQEITNTFSLPITLSYANKSKYLPEDDHDLSAHFAISYKLPTTAN